MLAKLVGGAWDGRIREIDGRSKAMHFPRMLSPERWRWDADRAEWVSLGQIVYHRDGVTTYEGQEVACYRLEGEWPDPVTPCRKCGATEDVFYSCVWNQRTCNCPNCGQWDIDRPEPAAESWRDLPPLL